MSTINITNIDPGEGQALPADTFLAVYGGVSILDLFYPVGIYIETSDASFNPNTAWGGVWVEDSWGRVTVAHQSDNTPFDTVGKVGGEQTHTLTVSEMPSHRHSVSNYRGTGKTSDSAVVNAEIHNDQSYWNFKQSGVSNYVGGGGAHNNLQPYIVVKRWHRTA